MEEEIIEMPRRGEVEIIFVRLFRLWALGQKECETNLSRMHQAASDLRLPDETAVACASLFELVGGVLGRTLTPECCCSKVFSADEEALLGILRVAPHLEPGCGSAAVPHGLPGAIHWAALTVRMAFGLTASLPRNINQPDEPKHSPVLKRHLSQFI